METTSRQPKGQPIGGQFAPTTNPEPSGVALTDPTISTKKMFDVEYQDGDGFVHAVIIADDASSAFVKVMTKENLHPRDIVDVNEYEMDSDVCPECHNDESFVTCGEDGDDLENESDWDGWRRCMECETVWQG